MRSDQQPVATHGNGFRLILRVLGGIALPVAASGCNHGDTNIANFSSLPAGVWRTFQIPIDPVDWDTYDVVVTAADC